MPGRYKIEVKEQKIRDDIEQFIDYAKQAGLVFSPDGTYIDQIINAHQQVEEDHYISATRQSINTLRNEITDDYRNLRRYSDREERRQLRQNKRSAKRFFNRFREDFEPFNRLNPKFEYDDATDTYYFTYDRPKNRSEAAKLKREVDERLRETRRIYNQMQQAGASMEQLGEVQNRIERLQMFIGGKRIQADQIENYQPSTLTNEYNDYLRQTGGATGAGVEYNRNRNNTGVRASRTGGGLLGMLNKTLGENTNLDQGQQARSMRVASKLTSLATLGIGALTIYAVYGAFFGKKENRNKRRGFLGIAAGLGTAAYIHGGRFKFPHQFFNEIMRGGYTSQVLGIDSSILNQTESNGSVELAQSNISTQTVQNILSGMTAHEIAQHTVTDSSTGRVSLRMSPEKDENGNPIPTLWAYRKSKGYNDRANAVASLANGNEGLLGRGLDALGVPIERIRTGNQENIDSYIENYNTRYQQIMEYMEKYNLKLKEGNRPTQLVEKFCRGEISSIGSLKSLDIFESKDGSEIITDSYDEIDDHRATLDAMNTVSTFLGGIPIATLIQHTTFQGGTYPFKTNFRTLATAVQDTDSTSYTNIMDALAANQEIQLQQQLSRSLMAAGIASMQDLQNNQTKTIRQVIESGQNTLANLVAFEEYCNTKQLSVNEDHTEANALLTVYYNTQFVNTADRTAALATLIQNLEAEGVVTFHTEGDLELKDISGDPNGHTEQLDQATPIPAWVKDQLILSGNLITKDLGSKLPTTPRFVRDQTNNSLYFETYDQIDKQTLIDRENKTISYKQGASYEKLDIQFDSIKELVRTANLLNMLTSLFAYESENIEEPRKVTGAGKLKFDEQTLRETTYDVVFNRNNPVQEARERKATNILSEDALKAKFPSLGNSEEALKRFATFLNRLEDPQERNLWMEQNDIEKRKRNYEKAQRAVEQINQRREYPLVLQAFDDTNTAEIYKLSTTVGTGSDQETYDITLDFKDKQIGGANGIPTPSSVSDLIHIATPLLNTKVLLGETGDRMVRKGNGAIEWVKDLPTNVKNLFVSLGTKLGISQQAMLDIRNGIKSGLKTIVDILGEIAETAKTLIMAALQILQALARSTRQIVETTLGVTTWVTGGINTALGTTMSGPSDIENNYPTEIAELKTRYQQIQAMTSTDFEAKFNFPKPTDLEIIEKNNVLYIKNSGGNACMIDIASKEVSRWIGGTKIVLGLAPGSLEEAMNIAILSNLIAANRNGTSLNQVTSPIFIDARSGSNTFQQQINNTGSGKVDIATKAQLNMIAPTIVASLPAYTTFLNSFNFWHNNVGSNARYTRDTRGMTQGRGGGTTIS